MSETVALGPWGRGQTQQGGLLGGNMLSMMGDIMRMRSMQQEFSARSALGNIAAGSQNIDEALARAQQDPTVMQRPDLLSELRQQQLLQYQTQAQQLGIANSGRDAIRQAFAAAGNNPDQLLPSLQGAIGTLPEQTRQMVMPYAMDIYQSVLGGTEGMPADQRAGEYAKRRAQFMIATKLGSPEEAYASAGTPWLNPQVARVPTATGAEQAVVVGGPQGAPAGAPAAGAPGQVGPVLGTGPGAAQAAYMHDRGTDMAKYQGSLDNAVTNGTNLMQTLMEARDILGQIRTGGLESTRARIAQFAQGLGLPENTVNQIAGGPLGPVQEFQKMAAQMAMGQVRQQIPPGSRLNRQEWETFERNNPNIDTDPHAINRIFNYWTRLYVRDRIEQREMQKFVKGGGDLSDWPAQWTQKAQDMGLVGPQFSTTGGQSVPPTAVNYLLDNPGERAAFDQKYGPGSAASFLGLSQ